MSGTVLSSKPNKWRVENSLICYALSVALRNVIKDKTDYFVPAEWIALLDPVYFVQNDEYGVNIYEL